MLVCNEMMTRFLQQKLQGLKTGCQHFNAVYLRDGQPHQHLLQLGQPLVAMVTHPQPLEGCGGVGTGVTAVCHAVLQRHRPDELSSRTRVLVPVTSGTNPPSRSRRCPRPVSNSGTPPGYHRAAGRTRCPATGRRRRLESNFLSASYPEPEPADKKEGATITTDTNHPTHISSGTNGSDEVTRKPAAALWLLTQF